MTVSRSLIKTLLVPAIALGAFCGTTAAASAATASLPAPAASHHADQLIQRGLYAVGFNAAIAKAHGYTIVTYKNGDQQAVPVNPKSHLPKSPVIHPGLSYDNVGTSKPDTSKPGSDQPDYNNTDSNSMTANCGTAWIKISQTGIDRVQLKSGFILASDEPPAVDFSWDVQLEDNNGVSNQTAGGALGLDVTWTGTWSNLYQYIYTYDYIKSGQATLTDGEVCYAGDPDVEIYGLN